MVVAPVVCEPPCVDSKASRQTASQQLGPQGATSTLPTRERPSWTVMAVGRHTSRGATSVRKVGSTRALCDTASHASPGASRKAAANSATRTRRCNNAHEARKSLFISSMNATSRAAEGSPRPAHRSAPSHRTRPSMSFRTRLPDLQKQPTGPQAASQPGHNHRCLAICNTTSAS